MQTKILYEDKDILVLHKPAGIAVQTAHVGQKDVESELKNYLAAGKAPYLGIVHRLDQPVEGLLVFAKQPKAAAELSRQLKEKDFCKEYLAVVCGRPKKETQQLVDYLIKENGVAKVLSGETEESQTEKQKPERQQDKKAKKAILTFEVRKTKKLETEACRTEAPEKKQEAEWLSLLQINLETGRFHQIRAQLAHAGFPIFGDLKYGGEKSAAMAQRAGARNLALCAQRLTFRHPVSHQEMVYTVSPMNPVFAFFKE